MSRPFNRAFWLRCFLLCFCQLFSADVFADSDTDLAQLNRQFLAPAEVSTPSANDCDFSDPANQVRINYATGLEIKYEADRKIIRIPKAWRQAKQPEVYVLTCDTSIKQDPRGRVIHLPVGKIAVLSTTYISHFELLNAVDRIAGVTNPDLIVSPNVRRAIDDGRIFRILSGQGTDIERILAAKPDLVMTFAFGAPEDNHPALKKFGLPYVLNAGYLEMTALGRAEWIKFTAAFLNMEMQANQVFSEIEKRYLHNKAIAEALPVSTVVMGGSPYGGTWYVPGGKSYVMNMVDDAGGRYPWSDDSSASSIAVDLESVLRRSQTASVWMTSVPREQMQQLLARQPRLNLIPPIKSGNIFTADAHPGYWELGVVNPHILLADIIQAIRKPQSDGGMVFYRRLPARKSQK